MTLSRRVAERLRLSALTGSCLSLLVVLLGMLTPADELPAGLPPDLLLHAIGFGTPALLAAFAALTGRGLVLAMAAIAAVGASAELAQLMVPGRAASLHDVIADVIGIAIGCSAGKLLQGLLLAPFQPNPGKSASQS